MHQMLLTALFVASAFAQSHARHAPAPEQQVVRRQTIATQTHESPYSAMVDSSEVVPGKCYMNGLPPDAAQGWFEATFTNDTLAPVRFSIDGFLVSVWKPMPMLAQMPDGQVTVVTHQGTDRVVMSGGQESYVLNPQEVCHLVFPNTRLDSAGRARWHYTVEQLRPVNPNGSYAALGIEGRMHTARHTVMFSVSREWVQFMTGDRHLDWHWSRSF